MYLSRHHVCLKHALGEVEVRFSLGKDCTVRLLNMAYNGNRSGLASTDCGMVFCAVNLSHIEASILLGVQHLWLSQGQSRPRGSRDKHLDSTDKHQGPYPDRSHD